MLSDIIKNLFHIRNTADTAHALDKGISLIQNLTSIALNKKLGTEQVNSFRSFKCVQDFLDRPLGHPNDTAVKRAFTNTLLTAKACNIIPNGMLISDDAKVVASHIDAGMDRVKLGYQFQTGKIGAIDVGEYYLDKGVAKVKTFTNTLVDKGVDSLINKGIDIISTVIPPVKAIAPIVKIVGKCVAEPVKNLIGKGITKVAEVAKTFIHSVGNAIKNVGRGIWYSLFS